MHFLDKLAENPVLQAPMAGVADGPYRAINRRYGSGICYSEMVSAKGLYYDKKRNKSHQLLRLAPEEKGSALIQLFGREPEIMASQAVVVADLLGEDILGIDINMGCPVPKVVNKGEGSALMKEPEQAARIVSAMREALDKAGFSELALTAKHRKGWSPDSVNAVAFAQGLESAGASAITVHGRTQDQFYTGRSDRSIIKAVKQAVKVPVIASGDAFTPESLFEIMSETGSDAVMVARGSYGNPWIFEAAAALRNGQTPPPTPGLAQRLALLRQHALESIEWYGDPHLARMRKHAAWYVAGQPAAAVFRRRLFDLSTLEELDALTQEYLERHGD
ncbi:MAG: tRNA dihydrouridine synthase DusB [Coriobacteriia bacterium]|nr:tRNA dihydrouridine synthase DusB [Coriobacteriia bacterium]MCL2537100.1 tRNA dihydrouridine synthase DusB [Coriobacteriia bacterium]